MTFDSNRRAGHEPEGPSRGRISPEARNAEGSPVSPKGRPEGESAPKRAARRVIL